jgi:RHS repeat-associated protein
VRTFSYDRLNRTTSEVWLDENNNSLNTINYNYDAASQLVSLNDSNSAYSYIYDLNGRPIEVNNFGTPGVPNITLNYTYDAVGNNLAVTDTLGGVENFSYDALNRVTTITQSGNDIEDKRVDLTYDKADQMTAMTRYNDLAGTQLVAQSNYTFDDFGRLTDLVHESESNILANYNWIYDEASRITQFTSTDGIINYTYDNLAQIISADSTQQNDESYSYDDNGNRTNSGYVTGENNQLLSDGTYNYEYDAEGNLIRQTEIATGVVEELTWDYRNRLTKVVSKDSSGNVVAESEYTYDVYNRRIAKSVDADGDGAESAEVERFVYDGEDISLVFDGDGNQTHRYLHGVFVDQIIADDRGNGEVLWALTDNLGTVRDVVNSDGVVVNHITYGSFGQITSETNPAVDFRFGYTGRELDGETGLYYYRARYYNPTTGRFLSEDPISFNAGDANLYRYVGNSPSNYIDPYGLQSELRLEQIAWEILAAGGAGLVYLGNKTGEGLGNLGNNIGNGIDRLIDKSNSYPRGNIPGLDKDKLSDFSNIKAVPEGLFDPNNINKPGSTSDLPFDNFPGTQLIPPSLDLPDSTIFPKDVPLDLPNVTTFPGGSCSADYPYLAPPFLESSGSFGNADPDVSIEKQLRGKAQLKDLRQSPNTEKGVNMNDLLQKTPKELLEMQKQGEITKKTLKQIQKAFEGRDLGKRGKSK